MRPSIARANSLLATCQKLSSVYRLSEPFGFDTNVTFNEKVISYYSLFKLPVHPYFTRTRTVVPVPETLLPVPVPAGTRIRGYGYGYPAGTVLLSLQNRSSDVRHTRLGRCDHSLSDGIRNTLHARTGPQISVTHVLADTTTACRIGSETHTHARTGPQMSVTHVLADTTTACRMGSETHTPCEDRFVARDAFVRTNRRAIAMMFVCLSVCPSVRLSVWDGRAL